MTVCTLDSWIYPVDTGRSRERSEILSPRHRAHVVKPEERRRRISSGSESNGQRSLSDFLLILLVLILFCAVQVDCITVRRANHTENTVELLLWILMDNMRLLGHRGTQQGNLPSSRSTETLTTAYNIDPWVCTESNTADKQWGTAGYIVCRRSRRTCSGPTQGRTRTWNYNGTQRPLVSFSSVDEIHFSSTKRNFLKAKLSVALLSQKCVS